MTDTNTFDWNTHLRACMNSTEYCCIATVDEKGVWSNPVFFAWDEHWNLYFISQMPSRHMQNLRKNARIAVSIYSTTQTDDVCGIQLEGTATIIENEGEKENAFAIYNKRSKIQSHSPAWHIVKITSEHLYYFDTKVFGEERKEVPMDKR